jgi:hypothetical protein
MPKAVAFTKKEREILSILESSTFNAATKREILRSQVGNTQLVKKLRRVLGEVVTDTRTPGKILDALRPYANHVNRFVDQENRNSEEDYGRFLGGKHAVNIWQVALPYASRMNNSTDELFPKSRLRGPPAGPKASVVPRAMRPNTPPGEARSGLPPESSEEYTRRVQAVLTGGGASKKTRRARRPPPPEKLVKRAYKKEEDLESCGEEEDTYSEEDCCEEASPSPPPPV